MVRQECGTCARVRALCDAKDKYYFTLEIKDVRRALDGDEAALTEAISERTVLDASTEVEQARQLQKHLSDKHDCNPALAAKLDRIREKIADYEYNNMDGDEMLPDLITLSETVAALRENAPKCKHGESAPHFFSHGPPLSIGSVADYDCPGPAGLD